MMTQPHTTREGYLTAAVEMLKPIFERAGFPLPPVRVSTGWPSKSALSAKSRRIGECWSHEAASDGIHQVFISPYLHEALEPQGVLPTLVHEVGHAAVGVQHQHKGPFRKMAKAVGLEGKMTSTGAGERLLADLKAISEKLGAYPHAKLDLTKSPRKKQGTRMIKCECAECGFTVRTSRKWLDEVGAPHCPKHGAMKFDLPDSDEQSEEGEE